MSSLFCSSSKAQEKGPGRVNRCSPAAFDMQFQIRRVASALQDTIWLPEVLKATAHTVDSWPVPGKNARRSACAAPKLMCGSPLMLESHDCLQRLNNERKTGFDIIIFLVFIRMTGFLLCEDLQQALMQQQKPSSMAWYQGICTIATVDEPGPAVLTQGNSADVMHKNFRRKND